MKFDDICVKIRVPGSRRCQEKLQLLLSELLVLRLFARVVAWKLWMLPRWVGGNPNLKSLQIANSTDFRDKIQYLKFQAMAISMNVVETNLKFAS